MTIASNFMSSKGNGEECIMHSKSDNIEITSHDKADEPIKQFFELVLSRYHIGLETSMKGCDFISDCVNLFYQCHKINLNRGGS